MFKVGLMVSIAAAGFVLAACNPYASSTDEVMNSAAASSLIVSEGWASPTPNGASVSGGYLTITNSTSQADALIAVSSPRAARAEIHEMSMEGDVMRMRAVDRIEVPAGEAISLAPGGTHLMFMDVAAPFAIGEEVPVTLTFEHAGAVEAALHVRTRSADGDTTHQPPH